MCVLNAGVSPASSRYTPPLPAYEVISLALVGLASGILGGLLGIGGSIIMIPFLTLFIRIDGELVDQHLAQAAAMIVNFFVAVPATLRHHRAKAVDWRAGFIMLPFGVGAIILGVLVSNYFDGRLLMGVFGVFLLYIVITNLLKVIEERRESEEDAANAEPKGTWQRLGAAGTIVGFAAGLLGIGGGTLMVPLLQRCCHFPLRRCIATSSAIMCITAAFGAVSKNLSLPELTDPGVTLENSLLIAACLSPTAFIGGLIGARLTHTLAIRWVRLAFIILLAIVSVRMLLSAFADV